MDALLAAAAEAIGVPVSMVERSAEARAKADGATIEDVLRAWSGGGAVVASSPAPEVAPAAAPAPEPEVSAPVVGAAVSGPMDEAAIVAAAAEKMGMPESMVRRSAAARAKAQGVDADAVLMEWAGVDPSTVAAASAASPTPAAPAATKPATPKAAASAAEAPKIPDTAQVPVSSPGRLLESEEAAAAAGALPRWLAALFVVIPAIAIAYALFLPNGPNCGDAGSLAIDPVTGLAVNCDGSAFGSDEVDLFSLGAETYAGVGCIACHGANGGGVATFPAFTNGELLATFPQDSCSAQIEWIDLGSLAWPDSTYGANSKPVGGSGAVMPSFVDVLSSQEIAAVAIYERVAFGGQALDAALADCGS